VEHGWRVIERASERASLSFSSARMFPPVVTTHAARLWAERHRYAALFRVLGLDPVTATQEETESAFLAADKFSVYVALMHMDDIEARGLCTEMCTLFDTRGYAARGHVDREPRLATLSVSRNICAVALLLRMGADPKRNLGDGTTPLSRVQSACSRTCGTFSLDCGHQTIKALMIDYDDSKVSGGS